LERTGAPGTVPVSSSIANINATGTYTVTSSANETVLALTTIPTATLDLTGGNFTALAGTGTGANAGTITVESGAVFTVGGTVKNSGLITLNITAQLSCDRDVTLEGGGKLTLSNTTSGFPQILGSTLTNVDNVISGVGRIQTTAALVNQTNGVVDANGSGSLRVHGTSSTNAGVLEATSAGDLVLDGPITNAASGVIGAFGAGSIVGAYPTVWAWMRAGTFPRSRIVGGKSMWLSTEVDAWLAELPVRRLKGDLEEAVA
jgi:hypothetical protein